MEQKGSKKKAEMNEEKRKKGGANNGKECCKKVKEEAENNDERGQPTKRIVGCNKSEKQGSEKGEKRGKQIVKMGQRIVRKRTENWGSEQRRGGQAKQGKKEEASKQEIEKIKEQTRELEEGSSQIQVTKCVF